VWWRAKAVLNLLLALALLCPALAAQPAEAQGGFNLPYGFIQETVVLGLDRPTSFALLPDGRILIAEKNGIVRVAQDGQLLPDLGSLYTPIGRERPMSTWPTPMTRLKSRIATRRGRASRACCGCPLTPTT